MSKTLFRTLAVTSMLALSVAACSKEKKAEETGVTQQADANPAATVPTPSNEAAAPDFVTKAAVSDMFEIESSKVALERSKNAEVKAFAKMMIDAHTKSTADLKAAIAASGQTLTPPAALPDDKAKDIADLKAADPKDFDKKYVAAQVDGHQATLDTVQRYANDGDVPAIKDFAVKLAPAVQEHLTHVKALKDKIDAMK
jgi:putative membrane protein